MKLIMMNLLRKLINRYSHCKKPSSVRAVCSKSEITSRLLVPKFSEFGVISTSNTKLELDISKID